MICEICKKDKFSTNSSLYKHVKDKHNLNSDQYKLAYIFHTNLLKCFNCKKKKIS